MLNLNVLQFEQDLDSDPVICHVTAAKALFDMLLPPSFPPSSSRRAIRLGPGSMYQLLFLITLPDCEIGKLSICTACARRLNLAAT